MPPSLPQPALKLQVYRRAWQRLARWLWPPRSRQDELLDRPGHSREALAGNFRDIQRLNRWFGGWSLAERSLRPFLPQTRERTNLYLLDLAAGVADVPLALARAWRRRGITLNITAVDLNPAIVEMAREAAGREGAANFEAFAADIFEYPWPESRSYDFVTCSLAFHHFRPEQCAALLQLMSRLSRRAFLVNDLRRSRFGWLGAKLLAWTIARHPLTRHDGPLSVLRAYTPAEMAAIARQAGLEPGVQVEIRRGPFSRLALLGYHSPAR